MFFERALEESGGDLDSAIKRLNELRLGSAENLGALTGRSDATQETGTQILTQGNGGPTLAEDSSVAKELHMQKTEWVELIVREMSSALNIEDAKARASRALEVYEKSICARATEATARVFQQESIIRKQQLEALIQENAILKRAFAIQRERQKEFEDRGDEVNQLKQMVAQYQERLRTLEHKSVYTGSLIAHFDAGNGGPTPAEDSSVAKELHMQKTEWVELIVREMSSALNIEDAKARASRALEVYEKSICARATEATARVFQQESIIRKQQLEALIQENAILKRAFAIQRERQKEFEDRGDEVNQLKQMVAQYQERLRTLEVNNYALTIISSRPNKAALSPGASLLMCFNVYYVLING